MVETVPGTLREPGNLLEGGFGGLVAPLLENEDRNAEQAQTAGLVGKIIDGSSIASPI